MDCSCPKAHGGQLLPWTWVPGVEPTVEYRTMSFLLALRYSLSSISVRQGILLV